MPLRRTIFRADIVRRSSSDIGVICDISALIWKIEVHPSFPQKRHI